ncbi:hypothetical protein TNCV_4715641, partial [Trichonephila clavipes]
SGSSGEFEAFSLGRKLERQNYSMVDWHPSTHRCTGARDTSTLSLVNADALTLFITVHILPLKNLKYKTLNELKKVLATGSVNANTTVVLWFTL